MDIFLLYLFTRLDDLAKFFKGMGIFFMLVTAATLVASFIALDRTSYSGLSYEGSVATAKKVSGRFRKTSFILAPLSLLFFTLMILTPTKEDVAFIVGGKIGIDVVQSTGVKETSSKLYQLLHKKLDEVLEE